MTTPEDCFSDDVSRLLRAVRFRVSKGFTFDKDLEDFMAINAEKCFQKNKTNRGVFRNEFKKMFEDEQNMQEYFLLLLSHGLIPSQPKWGLVPPEEQKRGWFYITQLPGF